MRISQRQPENQNGAATARRQMAYLRFCVGSNQYPKGSLKMDRVVFSA
ncbi:hypothetical protein [Kingella oralis]